MKKLLLVIPLLIWVACEDDNNDNSDYSFVNEWINCKQLSYQTEYDDGFQIGATFVWDGNSSMRYNNWGDLIDTYTYNEYGIPLISASQTGIVWNYEIIDKWKLSEEVTVDENGDTLTFCSYTWDGLTQYEDCHEANHINSVVTYNEYGMPLESYHININSGEPYDYEYWIYEEDGRREKYKTIEDLGTTLLGRETTWNGNKFETIHYSYTSPESGIISYKNVGEINEYYSLVEDDLYLYDNGNWDFISSTTYEYECPGFEQIYP